MRNRDLPVTKSLPSYMYTIRTRTVQYLYLHTVPTNLVVPTYLQYLQYIPWPGGGVQDHVLYIFLVRHASFINFLFFSPFVVARGIQKLPTYSTYLTWLFFMDAFYWFYTR